MEYTSKMPLTTRERTRWDSQKCGWRYSNRKSKPIAWSSWRHARSSWTQTHYARISSMHNVVVKWHEGVSSSDPRVLARQHSDNSVTSMGLIPWRLCVGWLSKRKMATTQFFSSERIEAELTLWSRIEGKWERHAEKPELCVGWLSERKEARTQFFTGWPTW